MAALDDDHLVVRVVYTGPPMAGKTQSVRALMPLLRGKKAERQVLSPGEVRGRTAFFDWADYEGGAYEGRPIRCQILSTPGQVALSDRRELLLRSADAVIMVVDSQPEALERASQCYEEMAPWLADAGREVPIRLILQCNKQDLVGALPAEALAHSLGLPCGKDVYATSARTGKGLRAAFVAGVRCAVERVRSLVNQGLVLEALDISSSEELFESMRRELDPLGGKPPRAAQLASRARQPVTKTEAPALSGAHPDARDLESTSRTTTGGSRSRPSRSGLFPASGTSSRVPAETRSVSISGSGTTPRAASSVPPREGPASSRSESSRAGAVSARAASVTSAPSQSAQPRPWPHEGGKAGAAAKDAAARPVRRPGASSAAARAVSNPPARSPSGPTARGASGPAARGASSPTARGASNPAARSPSSPAARGASNPAARGASSPTAPQSLRTPAAGTSDLAARGPSKPGARATSSAAPRGVNEPAARGPSGVPAAGANKAGAPATSSAAERSTTSPGSRGASPQPASAEVARADAVTRHAPAPRPPGSAASGRRAIVPPRAEPQAESGARGPDARGPGKRQTDPRPADTGATARGESAGELEEATLDRSPRRREEGSLDPAGAAARAWQPGSGPRPAVMPASAYHVWVPAPSRPISGIAPRPVKEAPAPSRQRSPASAGIAAPPSAAAGGLVARPRRYVAGEVRPAVMPASAYFEALRAAETEEAPIVHDGAESARAVAISSEPAAPARSGGAPSRAAPGSAVAWSPQMTRPAVMPASAYWAALERAPDDPAHADRTHSAAPASHAGKRDAVGAQSSSWEGASASPRDAASANAAIASDEAVSTRDQPSSMTRAALGSSRAAPASLLDAVLDGDDSEFERAWDFAQTLPPPLDASLAGEPGSDSDESPAPTAALHATRTPESAAALDAAQGPSDAPGPEVVAPPSPSRELGGRPAVMPASAYFALLAAGVTVMPARTPPVAPARRTRDTPEAASALSSAPPAGVASAHERALAAASPESSVRRPGVVNPTARPAVMPASAWRAGLSLGPKRPDEPASRRDAMREPSLREPSAGARVDADDGLRLRSEAVAGKERAAAPPSLRLLQGGTNQQSEIPAARAQRQRPALTLLQRPAVMPASAWRAGPQPQRRSTAARSFDRDVARPAVMPASAWRAMLRAAEEAKALADPPVAAPTAQTDAMVPPDGAPRVEAASAVATPSPLATPSPVEGASPVEAAPIEAAGVSGGLPLGEGAPSPEVSTVVDAAPSVEAAPAVEAAPSLEVSTVVEAAPAVETVSDVAPWVPLVFVDEPSEALQLPETPPGLQAFVAAGRRALAASAPAEQPSDRSDGDDESDGWELPETPPAPFLREGTSSAVPAASLERGDTDRAQPEPPEAVDETPSFCFPGPRLPGQARVPLAVWRRAGWRLIETQITAYAPSLQDGHGRWIGELAPGWFARTLCTEPDQRSARRAFAAEVLRERTLGRFLSRPRCVVLTEEADRFWIWQAVCRAPTLTAVLRARIAAAPSASAVAEVLLEASLGYLEARQGCLDARVPLPLSPHTLSQQEGRIVYSGLMPDPGRTFAEPSLEGDAAFEAVLRKVWPEAPVDSLALLTELRTMAAGRLPEPLLELIGGVIGKR